MYSLPLLLDRGYLKHPRSTTLVHLAYYQDRQTANLRTMLAIGYSQMSY